MSLSALTTRLGSPSPETLLNLLMSNWERVAITGCALVVIALLRRRSTANDVPKVQKPRGGHWLWGNERDAWDTVQGEYYLNWTDRLGSVFALKGALFHPDILVVTDPAALHHIFTTKCYDFSRSPALRRLTERLVGRGLVWAHGEEHRQQRQLLVPVFTQERLRAVSDVIFKLTDRMVDKLRDQIVSDSTSEPVKVNALKWMGSLTLDIIGAVGFGHDFECGESQEAQDIQRTWNALANHGLYPAAFYSSVVVRAFPWIASLPLKAIKAQAEVKRIIREKATIMMDKGDDELDGGSGKDLMSAIRKLGSQKTLDVDGILDHLSTFVVAGSETTSGSLAFTLMELARNQDLQARLRDEVVEFRGSGPCGMPSYDEFQTKLPLLDAVVKEVLRMYPPLKFERVALKDSVLPLTFPITSTTGETLHSIRIRKGQVIVTPSLVANCTQASWGSDARQFRPDRWLNPGELPPPSHLTSGVSGLITFNEGPRLCIGWRLAMFEFKVILVAMVKAFEFSPTGEAIEPRWSPTLQPCVVGSSDGGVKLPLMMKLREEQ